MADLAKLVVRLEAQSAQLLQELDKANNKLARFERNAGASLDRINKRFSAFGFGVKTVLGTFLAGVSFNAIVKANEEATAAFANLENAVERAGDAAGGRTADDFARTATALADITTNTDEAVQGVQQLLLRFQNIRTDRFDDATKSVLDFAQATGRDLSSAAEVVGKALSSPEKGMTALAKAGVIFSNGQKKVIKDLVDTGRTAEAQALILAELDKRFGGAAEAARNTFAGALKAVRNSLGELLESDGGLPEATESMNELAKTLQDPAVRAGADALFSVIVRGAAAAAEFIGKTVAGLAILAGQGQNAAVNLDNQIRQTEEHLKFLKQNTPFTLVGSFEAEQIEKTTKKLAELRAEYNKLMGLGLEGAMNAKTGKGMPGQAGAGAFELPEIVVLGTTEELEELRKKMEQVGKALTDSLMTPQEKYNVQVATADKLLAANIITLDTWARALGAARGELDALNEGMLEVDERFQSADDIIEQWEKDLAASTSDALDQQGEDLVKEFDKVLEKSEKAWTVFTDQAARNTQDILADSIYDGITGGFDDGLEGLLDSFGEMLTKMAAQAVAADIAGKLFGIDEDGKPGGGSGWIDKAFDWLGGLGKGGSSGSAGASSNIVAGEHDWLDAIMRSGGGGGGWFDMILGLFGSMDQGGHGHRGKPVAIGVGAQPELFVPDTAGEFYPAGSWGGGATTVNQNIYTPGPITPHSARQLEVEAARRQRIALTRLG